MEALAAAGEGGPVEEIEVGLLDLDEAEEAIDGGEAGAEVEGAGACFLDEDIDVLAASDIGIAGVDLDATILVEVAEVLEAALADVDEIGVVKLAG